MPDSGLNSPAAAKRYSVGTLTYTKMGLAKVIFWLVLGHICLSLMNASFSMLMVRIHLLTGQVSNSRIALFTGTIPGVFGFIMAYLIDPVIRFKSDRHRGKRGRRIPFLLWAAPFMALFVIILSVALSIEPASKPGSFAGWMCVCLSLHSLLFGFVSGILTLLAVDVVPAEYMGRFFGLWMVAGSIVGMVPNYWTMRISQPYSAAISIGIGVLAIAGYVSMCLAVKEGEYSPPPTQSRGGLAGMAGTYYRECFRNKFFILFFAAFGLGGMALCCRQFDVYFEMKNLNLSLPTIGKISASATLVTVLFTVAAGYLCDRIHPFRVLLYGMAAAPVIALVSLFCVHGWISLMICSYLAAVASATGVAWMPLMVVLLPKDRFGQFSWAAGTLRGVVSSIIIVLGGAVAGPFIEWVGNYRYIYVWSAVMSGISFIAVFLVYRDWLRRGSAKFGAPPETPDSRLEVAATESV